MRIHRVRRLVAAAALVALVVPSGVIATAAADETGPCPTGTPTDSPSTDEGDGDGDGDGCDEPEQPEDNSFTVTNAQFRWGMNNESNNRAYNPGTYNFFSAGQSANPGRGGSTINMTTGRWSTNQKIAWRAKSGDVRIQKRGPGKGYKLATLPGLQTDRMGKALGSPGTSFSDHQIVINGGSGEVDPAAGTAEISWEGTWSVLYYSGMSFFHISNPTLTVTEGSAQVTGMLGGFKSDRNNQDLWKRVAPREVVLADLPRDSFTLPVKSGKGFSVTPKYIGVEITAPAGTPQKKDVNYWGSFPQDYINFVTEIGQGPYWYSSGVPADRHKPALPMTISYEAARPATPEEPPKTDSPPDDNSGDDPTNDPPQQDDTPPPPDTTQPGDGNTSTSDDTTDTTANLTNPTSTTPVDATSLFDLWRDDVPTVYALASADGAIDSGHPWKWWTGSLLLLGAAVISVLGRFAKGNR